MKARVSSTWLAAAAAATVSASGLSDVESVQCARPNANFCIAGDIILRCDGHGIGTPGRCGANVAGYPPQGGTAVCYESAKGKGDAACQKNCVVYAQPSFTLPADQCKPSYTAPAAKRDEGAAVENAGDLANMAGAAPAAETGFLTIPEGTGVLPVSQTGFLSVPEGTGQPSPPNTRLFSIPEGTGIAPSLTETETGMMSIPEGTSLGTAVMPDTSSSAPSASASSSAVMTSSAAMTSSASSAPTSSGSPSSGASSGSSTEMPSTSEMPSSTSALSRAPSQTTSRATPTAGAVAAATPVGCAVGVLAAAAVAAALMA